MRIAQVTKIKHETYRVILSCSHSEEIAARRCPPEVGEIRGCYRCLSVAIRRDTAEHPLRIR